MHPVCRNIIQKERYLKKKMFELSATGGTVVGPVFSEDVIKYQIAVELVMLNNMWIQVVSENE